MFVGIDLTEKVEEVTLGCGAGGGGTIRAFHIFVSSLVTLTHVTLPRLEGGFHEGGKSGGRAESRLWGQSGLSWKPCPAISHQES